MPPPPPSNYDHYVECRYCGRKYAQNVAERHIPKCANIINKPGGIKPSRIQEKYISGTGSGSKNLGNNSSITNSKPNMAISKSNVTNANSYVKPPPNTNPFGDPYANSKNNYSYGSYQQQGGSSGKGLNTNPFEKQSANSKPLGSKVSNPVKNEGASYLKPGFNSKTNPSNYW
jgi:hypothetical protein